MIRINYFTNLLFILLLIIIAASSCTSTSRFGSLEIPNFDTVQKQVAFKIVVPAYLPDDFNSRIVFSRIANAAGQPIAGVHLELWTNSFMRVIIIDEEGGQVEFQPEDIDSVIFLKETRFVERQVDHYLGKGIGVKTGFGYHWTKNNVTFFTRIYDYDIGECRKIVGSMIQ
jgi:hypothetical protein